MQDLDRLDAFLSSDESPEDCMMLSDLDGFLHGIACSPVLIPAEEWMTIAVGGAPEEIPQWVLHAIGELYWSIGDRLMSDPPEVEPILWQTEDGQVSAMDWCEGFMDAVRLRPNQWEAFTKTEEGAKLMLPILVHMFDDEGNSMLGLRKGEIDEALRRAADAIPEVIPEIFRMMMPRIVN